MNRRIARAILLVAAFAVVAFALPLAYAVGRFYHDEEIVRLERIATAASGNLSTAALSGRDPVELRANSDGTRLAVYTPRGKKIAGDGPLSDRRVDAARNGQVSDGTVAGELVVAVPISREEAVTAIIRAGTPVAVVSTRVHRAWLLMLAIGVAVLGAAGILAVLESRRLARPVKQLTAAATRLGQADFTVSVAPSGVAELDRAGEAITATAQRLGEVLARERSFSADASHQLRTPLAALRLRLETAVADPNSIDVPLLLEAIEDVSRLEITIGDLLQLARDVEPSEEPLALEPVLEDLEREWRGTLANADRPLRLEIEPDITPASIRDPALRQIMAVLLSNAAAHGAGAVILRARSLPGGVAIDVEDDGRLPPGDTEQLFERRAPGATGTGIGLALARSIAEAEGARLVVQPGRAAHFTLFMTCPPSRTKAG